MASASYFSVSLSCKGQSVTLENSFTTSATGEELYQQTRQAFGFAVEDEIKLLYKGKKLQNDSTTLVFSTIPKKLPKIMVMATSNATVQKIAEKTSDPLLRGFEDDDEKKKKKKQQEASIWGTFGQDKNYKFVKFEACTWQSFGHRPTESTPHAFAAQRLLEQLATDPGIVAIMKERELVVNTLGEMDPIDDRLMQAKQHHGGCLLGYNTNHGLRIDIKLRTEDLQGFRPYPELASTLIHELSHNWVGDHNLLFWTNHGQMRAEYLYHHIYMTSVVKGKTTAELAGLSNMITKDTIFPFIMQELAKDMQQHGLHPNMIQAPIQQRCQELENQYLQATGQRLGGTTTADSFNSEDASAARERMLEAAERRRQQQDKKS